MAAGTTPLIECCDGIPSTARTTSAREVASPRTTCTKAPAALKVPDKLGSRLRVSAGAGEERKSASAELHHPGGQAASETAQTVDKQIGGIRAELKFSPSRQDGWY